MGVKESEPPKRVRSNDFSGGNLRRSRSSSKIPQVSVHGYSSGKRQSSMSRLPVPGASKSRTGGRSSSSGGQNGLGTTPLNKVARPSSGNRSSERLKGYSRNDFMTPQRVTTSKKSMASTERRMTNSAMHLGSHQRLSGRGSQIGAKGSKDTRPLHDKTFRQSQIRKILDFLRMTNYPNTSLTSKHFPLSSKEFVMVFNFIYFHLDPSTDQVLPLHRFEEEVPKLLKSLNYPGNLSKSNFSTMGSLHSWPTVLGSLAYLCDLASLFAKNLYPNVVALSFPMKDDMGFAIDRESDDKLIFECNLRCMAEYNAGADEFPEQLQTLRGNLMENNGVDMERLEYLKQHKDGLEAELIRLDGRDNKKVDLLKERQVRQADIEKLTNYLQEVKNHNQMKVEKTKIIGQENEEISAQIQTLNGIVIDLKANCDQGKVSQYEVEGNKVLIGEKRKQIEVARKEVEEIEKEVWEKEIDVARKRDGVDMLVKQVNSLAMQEGLRSQSGELVALEVHSFQGGRDDEMVANNSMRAELGELAKSARTSTRNTERELQATVATTEQGKREIMTRRSELESKEKEVSRISDELIKNKEQISVEEKYYNDELTAIKDQLHHLKSTERVNKEVLERELVAAKEKLGMKQFQREKYKSDGILFLRKVSDRAVSYMEECTGYRDSAARAVLDAAKARVELVKKASCELEDKVEKALQYTQEY